jgi:hypothetical protein
VNNLSFSHFDRVMMATEVARRLGSPAMARRFLRWRYPEPEFVKSWRIRQKLPGAVPALLCGA